MKAGVKRERTCVKQEKMAVKRKRAYVKQEKVCVKREQMHSMKQEKVHVKEEKMAVKKEKTWVKQETSHTKQEIIGPYQMYYHQFGKKMSNAEYIAALHEYNKQQDATMCIGSLGRDFETQFRDILISKGKALHEISAELDAVRHAFKFRSRKFLNNHLQFMRRS